MKNRVPRPRTGLSRVFSWLFTAVTLVLIVLAILLVAVPRIVGGMSLTVLTGSMEPGIMPGDIVVTKGITEANIQELEIGDVISFLPYSGDPTLATHRIVGKTVNPTGLTFITQGDNNPSADWWGPVTAAQIRGKLLFVVPKLGYVGEALGDNAELLAFVGAVALIVYGGSTIGLSLRRPRGSGSLQESPS